MMCERKLVDGDARNLGFSLSKVFNKVGDWVLGGTLTSGGTLKSVLLIDEVDTFLAKNSMAPD